MKTERFEIKLSEEERAWVSILAKKCGLTMSAMMRQLLWAAWKTHEADERARK